ncbi:MAG: MmgE/PrpD family protein [Nocardioides sp.]
MSASTSDRVIGQLADFCARLRFEDLPEDTVVAATERLVDSIGCAVGGLRCDAVRIGRLVAPTATARPPALVGRAFGDQERTLPLPEAAFLNSAAIRYLDFNDAYAGGHPSDALGALIALADARDASGAQLVTALVAGYEIFLRLCDAATLRERGWDQGFGIALATAAGASVLLELDREQTAHALSIAAVANVPMRATRAGELSLWKGAATAYAASGALYSTLLAAQGMSGPSAPVTGRHGLQDLVTGELELDAFDPASSWVRRARIKYWPVEYHLQAAVWAGVELGGRLDEREVERLEVETYWSCWHETGSESSKWDPRTRETADHSLPYVLATAFRTGRLDLAAFDEAAYLATDIRPLMDRVTVQVADDIQEGFPHTIRMRVTARLRSGEAVTADIVNPRGHEDNPVPTREIGEKMLRLVAVEYGEEQARRILQGWEAVSTATSLRPLLDLLVPASDASTPTSKRG